MSEEDKLMTNETIENSPDKKEESSVGLWILGTLAVIAVPTVIIGVLAFIVFALRCAWTAGGG